ncbi:MAG: hypothetical protein AB8V29_04750, partial [Rickettsia conorii subsp. raoultii]
NDDISLAIVSLKDKYFNIKDFEEDLFWKNWQENFEDLNKVTPYFDKEFEKLRSKLFINVVRLHEIFINANTDNFWHSLQYFFDMAVHSSGDPKINKISLWSYLLCLQLFTHSIKCWQHPNIMKFLGYLLMQQADTATIRS